MFMEKVARLVKLEAKKVVEACSKCDELLKGLAHATDKRVSIFFPCDLSPANRHIW